MTGFHTKTTKKQIEVMANWSQFLLFEFASVEMMA